MNYPPSGIEYDLIIFIDVLPDVSEGCMVLWNSISLTDLNLLSVEVTLVIEECTLFIVDLVDEEISESP